MKLNRVVVFSVIVVGLGACGGDDAANTAETTNESRAPSTSVAATSAGVSTSVLAGVAASLPEGTFERIVDLQEAIDRGLSEADVVEVFRGSDQTIFTFKIEGDRWTQFQTFADGTTEIGDLGLQHLDAEGHLVQAGGQDGSGDVFVIDWSLDGDQLTLVCLSGCIAADSNPVTNLVVEGIWTRTS